MNTWSIFAGDARKRLADVADRSVRCCVTSPPYWGLRDYGHVGQIGLEPSPDLYTAELVSLFRDVRRVLSDDGTLWLNLGDSYANDGKWGGETSGIQAYLPDADRKRVGREKRVTGLKPKDLVGIPWRVAFALQADGWYLRSDIIWAKSNPMPESVTDRPTKAHEYLFLLAKSARYYYDAEAIKEATEYQGTITFGGPAKLARLVDGQKGPSGNEKMTGRIENYDARNKRSVWTVATQPYPEAHFATYPEDLIEPCILAGSAIGDTVLDPFCGSGTTGAVAIRRQRNFVGVELNVSYITLARKRISAVSPLFAVEEVDPRETLTGEGWY